MKRVKSLGPLANQIQHGATPRQTSTAPLYINLANHNTQEGPSKNSLGIGIFGHVKNYKAIKHIEITHFDGNIL